MFNCAAEVRGEKEPASELFCVAFFSCSEMTVSRKLNAEVQKWGGRSMETL